MNEDIGLMDYKARFYSPYLNRFIQPDSLIPNIGNPQNFNRYSYVLNRPINNNDPTGHCSVDSTGHIAMNNGKIAKTDCTVEDFEELSWEQRQEWVDLFVDENQLKDWHNDMEFAIKFMAEDPIHSQSTSAAFFMDAAVLQSMNDGMNIFQERPCISHCDETQLWDDFYSQIESSNLQMLIELRILAEQGGVDVATDLAIQNGLYDPYSTNYDDLYFGVFLSGANGYRYFAILNNQYNHGGLQTLFDPRESGETLYNIGNWTNKPLTDLFYYQINKPQNQNYHIPY